jgi:hypothetical protein
MSINININTETESTNKTDSDIDIPDIITLLRETIVTIRETVQKLVDNPYSTTYNTLTKTWTIKNAKETFTDYKVKEKINELRYNYDNKNIVLLTEKLQRLMKHSDFNQNKMFLYKKYCNREWSLMYIDDIRIQQSIHQVTRIIIRTMYPEIMEQRRNYFAFRSEKSEKEIQWTELSNFVRMNIM